MVVGVALTFALLPAAYFVTYPSTTLPEGSVNDSFSPVPGEERALFEASWRGEIVAGGVGVMRGSPWFAVRFPDQARFQFLLDWSGVAPGGLVVVFYDRDGEVHRWNAAFPGDSMVYAPVDVSDVWVLPPDAGFVVNARYVLKAEQVENIHDASSRGVS